jgi:ribonuclease T2
MWTSAKGRRSPQNPRGRALHVTFLVAVFCLFAANAGQARSHRRPRSNRGRTFDYYLLALSYAPDFCAQPVGNKDPRECGAGRHVGFVVHGLWPQSESGRGPKRCGPASPVSEDLIRVTLNYVPSESLIQHEWENHGTCSGLSANEYFAAMRRARDSITIPQELKAPARPMRTSPADIEGKFAAANPRFPKDAFRVSCYQDGELQEVRICFNKDLTPRGCGSGSGQCATSGVDIRPVK